MSDNGTATIKKDPKFKMTLIVKGNMSANFISFDQGTDRSFIEQLADDLRLSPDVENVICSELNGLGIYVAMKATEHKRSRNGDLFRSF